MFGRDPDCKVTTGACSAVLFGKACRAYLGAEGRTGSGMTGARSSSCWSPSGARCPGRRRRRPASQPCAAWSAPPCSSGALRRIGSPCETLHPGTRNVPKRRAGGLPGPCNGLQPPALASDSAVRSRSAPPCCSKARRRYGGLSRALRGLPCGSPCEALDAGNQTVWCQGR